MDVVDQFAAEAEGFAHWARFGKDEGSAAARNGLLHITRLYLAALVLPHLPDRLEHDVPRMRVDDAERKSVFANAARLPLDAYSEIFDPLPVPASEPGTGSLSDDIADMYRDIVTGLHYYRAGHRASALWEWTFSLQIHWGEHATGAIRALHCWLARNDPSGLSAGP